MIKVNIISLLVVLLFLLNRQICFLFYPNDIDSWWLLRTNIYAVIFGGSLYLTRLKHEKFSMCVLFIGIQLSVSDIIDRLVYGITYFTYTDYFLIPLAIIIGVYKYYKK